MGYKENQRNYIKRYIKETYHRVDVIFRKDEKNEIDTVLWEYLDGKAGKMRILKELAFLGLRCQNQINNK